jgi:putative membrane protein
VSWSKRRERIEPIRHEWFDDAKLRDLGFRGDIDPSDPDALQSYEWLPRRYAYVVLEYDGPAFAAWLAAREKDVEAIRGEVDAEALLDLARAARSRLFPVDASLDADELFRRYPERGRHLVLRGVVAAHVVRGAEGPPLARGFIASLLVDEVHVPRQFRPPLTPFLPTTTETEFYDQADRTSTVDWPPARPPRYRATLAVGRRLEPWLRSLTVVPGGRRIAPREGRTMRLLVRWVVSIAALFVAAWLVPGIEVDGNAWIVFAAMAVILGLVNAVVRPILRLLTCPLIILTLGAFLLVINGLTLWLASWIAVHVFQVGFRVNGFVAAFLGALVVSIVSVILSVFVPDPSERRPEAG